ncbi:uncharacterized protein LOC119580938 [Penaeus monodon]|uniref:uncharacterized protein LOC119580938 n=1 Tax=Penaeus monodon TaxID=6687 RepID=UPI0018A7B0BF|nr:uncharacterized protein LOC119580938 [Penaeus monodon]
MNETTTEIVSALINITSEAGCTREVLDFEPSATEFLEALGIAGWVLLGMATIAFVTLVGLLVDTLRHVVSHCHPRHKATTCVVLSVYPVIGLCSYLGLLFQKANMFLDATAQLWFALCMWQFLQLTLSYFGGESRFVRKMEGTMLPWKGPPCCCWPLLRLLPQVDGHQTTDSDGKDSGDAASLGPAHHLHLPSYALDRGLVHAHGHAAQQRLYLHLPGDDHFLFLRSVGLHCRIQGVSAATAGVPLHAQDHRLPADARFPTTPGHHRQFHPGAIRGHPVPAAHLAQSLRQHFAQLPPPGAVGDPVGARSPLL